LLYGLGGERGRARGRAVGPATARLLINAVRMLENLESSMLRRQDSQKIRRQIVWLS